MIKVGVTECHKLQREAAQLMAFRVDTIVQSVVRSAHTIYPYSLCVVCTMQYYITQ